MSGQDARYNMSIALSFEKNHEITAHYLHIFIINLWCFKYILFYV